MSALSVFLAGVISAGHALAAMFFLKFWRRTGDTLFAAFSAAFCLLALNQFLAAEINIPREEQSWIYLLRLGAFVLIAAAILYKNLGRPPTDSEGGRRR
jgi:Family of unknown function (DUF5985)